MVLLQGVSTMPTRDLGSACSGCQYPLRAPHSGIRAVSGCQYPLRPPTQGYEYHCLVASIGLERLRDTTLTENLEWSPYGSWLNTATPSGNSCSCPDINCISSSFPLDLASKAKRGILMTVHPRISITFAQACALERSLQCRFPSNKNNTGDSSYGL